MAQNTQAQPPSASAEPHVDDVLAVWGQLLGRDDIAADDDFLEVADYALLPAAVGGLHDRLGVRLPVADVLEARTARAWASLVAERSPAQLRRVVPRPAGADPVLSFDQQRIWMETQLLPEGAYNNHARRRLVGPLDVAVMERCVRAIINRHESLRSRFPTRDDHPVQLVDDPDPGWTLPVAEVDPDAPDRMAAGLALLEADATGRFELESGPLFRVLLVRLSQTEHLLGLTMHQIVSDSHSIYTFERELGALYAAGGDAEAAALPTLSVQYRDFAVWQRRYLSGDVLQAKLDYWRDHLTGAPPVLALPTASRRTAIQDAVSSREELILTPEQTQALHDLCGRADVTVFTVLLAGLATVLSRWSGQQDLVLGTAYEGRTDAEVEKLIGIVFNILPFRLRLDGDPTFSDLLVQARSVALAGFERAEAPIDLIIADLRAPRDPRRTPVFEVVLNVTAPPEDTDVPGLAVEWLGTSQPRTRFDLFINAQEYDGRLHVTFDYAARRFDPAIIGRLADQFGTLLGAAAADPARPVTYYPLEPAPSEDAAPGATTEAWTGAIGADDRMSVLSGRPGPAAAAAAARGATGAALIPPNCAVTADPEQMLTWLKEQQVTVLLLCPPVLRTLTGAAASGGHSLPALRQVYIEHGADPVGGDLLPVDVVALRALAPQARCTALYRIGADGTPAASYDVPGEWTVTNAPTRAPLGQGPALRVVTAAGKPTAVGEVGELRVAGTATDELARRWPDGTVEFVRRADADPVLDAVEVAATLRDMPRITDAVVLRQPDETEPMTVDAPAPRLRAHVAGADLDPATLTAALRARLPGYLIPDLITCRPRLPLTDTGDYDLAALDTGAGPAPDRGQVAPRTPMERELAALVTELLDGVQVGLDDSFFELGGFSLLATQLATRIQSRYGVQLSLRSVFERPTVAGLAELILLEQGGQAGDDELAAMLDEIERTDGAAPVDRS